MISNGTQSSGEGTATDSSNTLLHLTTAAFAISIAAIVLSTLQALLAYLQFDNSEVGRRRCSAQMMGLLWSQKTTRKFKWKEFRYQVFFEVPVFYTAELSTAVGPVTIPKPATTVFNRFWRLSNAKVHDKPIKPIYQSTDEIPKEVININKHVQKIYKVTGTKTSFRETMTEFRDNDDLWKSVHTADDEGCSWVLFLDALQGQERVSQAWDSFGDGNLKDRDALTADDPWINHTICYMMQKKQRCWDFMPSGINKPYATTTLCHLVEMMSMLGLVWTVFDMKRPVLSAEGNGYMAKCEYIKGLGIMTKFSRFGKPQHTTNRIIPCLEVKRLCFGEVPSLFDSPGRNLKVGSFGQLQNCLEHLLPRLPKDNANSIWKGEQPLMFPSTFELIAMVAKSVHINGSKFRMLPNPCAEAWTPGLDMIACLEAFGEEFNAIINNCPDFATHDLIMDIKKLFENGRSLSHKIQRYADTKVKLTSNEGHMFSSEDEKRDMVMRAKIAMDGAYIDLLDSIHAEINLIDDKLRVMMSDVCLMLTSHFTATFNNQQFVKEALNVNGAPKEKILMKFYFMKVGLAASLTKAQTIPTEWPNGTVLLLEEKEHAAVWFALNFRMWSWFCLHDFNPLDKMIERTEFLGSRLPVYIG